LLLSPPPPSPPTARRRPTRPVVVDAPSSSAPACASSSSLPRRPAAPARPRPSIRVASSSSSSSVPAPRSPSSFLLTPHARAVAALSVATVLLGAANRVLYKAALDAAGGAGAALYMAALQGAAPALVYGSILRARERAGRVPSGAAAEALLGSRWRLASVGAGEAASSALSFAAAARLPGALLPLLQQTMLVWQLSFERLVLGRVQPARRIAGALCVVAGVCLAAWPGKAAGKLLSATPVPLDAAAVFALAMAFPAVAFLTKEAIFADAAAAAGGRPLDVFAVAARTSAIQAGVVLALLPMSVIGAGVPLGRVGPTLAAGVAGVLGPSAPNGGLLPLAYVAVNIAFNVALISLVARGGALAAGVSAAVLVPVAAAAFCVPWPGLPPPGRLGPLFGVGVAVSVAGLALVLATPPPKAGGGGSGDGGGDTPLVLGEEPGP
jgi:hypothetical protein